MPQANDGKILKEDFFRSAYLHGISIRLIYFFPIKMKSYTDVENKRMDTKGGKRRGDGGGGGMNWEIGIDMYTLMCIKKNK